MKKIFFTCILLLPAVFAYPQNSLKKIAQIEKKSFEKTRSMNRVMYPGDSGIDVTYYKLDLDITYSPNYLKGAVTVNAKSTTSSLNSIFLDLQNALTVDSVKMGDKHLSFSQSTSKLNINLDKNYLAGQGFSIIVYYQGVPGSSGFGSFAFGQHSGQPAIWSLSEPYGASDWWPCKDTPADKADSSDVWITCDAGLTAVSNGSLVSHTTNSDGTETFKWKNHYPIAQYLISVAIADYTEYDLYYHYGSDSMLVANYVYPETFSNAKKYLDETVNMIDIFSKKYGQYPFIKEKYAQVQFGWGGGMEHQTATSLGGFGEELQSHELAHQWFGDKVTCKDWQDIWLNEGFATYSEAVYFEAKNGEQSYRSYMNGILQGAKNARGSIYVQNIGSVNDIFNYSRSYLKGAAVLYMLRGIVGDSTFFKILRTYDSDPKYAYGVATTADFESVAEQVYGSGLKYFFDEWIYGENYPSYSMYWNYALGENNKSVIDLDISQAVNSNPAFFTMPIKLLISTSLGDTTVTVFNNMQDQTFHIEVNGVPNYITFDPDNDILKEITITDSTDRTKPSAFVLEQNYPNPFNPSTTITYRVPVQDKGYVPVKLILYDASGKQVKVLVDGEKEAGRYRINFKGDGLASGVYFYTLTSGSYSETKKMLLLK